MPDYIRLIEEFQQFEGLALEISGEGEPLMSELTIPIIQIASQMGIWTTLITNGHRLTETIIKELVGLRVALVLSLHSLVQETYECDSGVPHSFKRKMRAIDLAAKHFSGTEWRENGQTIKRAAIHFTLQANNVHEVPRIREFCDKNGLLFSIAPLARTGHATQRPELWLSEETRLEGINSRGDESIIFYDEPDGRRVCGTCKYGLNIGADGELLLDAHGGYEADIANIRDISFRQAIELQHDFSQRMFSQLDCFCPVRDPDWQSFLDNKGYQ